MADDGPEIFMPPNLLKAKVGGTVSGLDTAAVKRAEVAMAKLRPEFSDWLTSDVKRLTQAHRDFGTSRDERRFDILFRAAHDLRGQAATFEYPLIARAAASTCKLMNSHAVENLPSHLVDAHINAIVVIHREEIKDTNNRTALTLVEELESQVAQAIAGLATP